MIIKDFILCFHLKYENKNDQYVKLPTYKGTRIIIMIVNLFLQSLLRNLFSDEYRDFCRQNATCSIHENSVKTVI